MNDALFPKKYLFTPVFPAEFSEISSPSNPSDSPALAHKKWGLAQLKKIIPDLPVQGLAILIRCQTIHPARFRKHLKFEMPILPAQDMQQALCRFEEMLAAADDYVLKQTLPFVTQDTLRLMARPSVGLLKLLTRIEVNNRPDHPLWHAWFVLAVSWLKQQIPDVSTHVEPLVMDVVPLKPHDLIDSSCVAIADWMNLLPLPKTSINKAVSALSEVRFAPFISSIRSSLTEDRKALLDDMLNAYLFELVGEPKKRPGITSEQAARILGMKKSSFYNIRHQLPDEWFFDHGGRQLVDCRAITALKEHIFRKLISTYSTKIWSKMPQQKKSEHLQRMRDVWTDD